MTTDSHNLADAHLGALWTPFIQMKSVRDHGPLIFERAEGIYLYDDKGKRYIDGHGSLWLMNVGFGRKEIELADGTDGAQPDLVRARTPQGPP